MEDLQDVKKISLRELKQLHESGNLFVDRTYQRASNWKIDQQQFFIDSVLREFPIPMIYLQHVNGKYYIVDGQQRINSLIRYVNNEFKLLEPSKNRNIFPKYITEQQTGWSNKLFRELDSKNQKIILDVTMPLALLEYEDHIIRDLFVRLQKGVPLTGQQKRDASVSGYNDFVLKIGGKDATADKYFELKIKDGIETYEGHDFFRECVKSESMDKGKLRQLVAQTAMLYFELIDEDRIVDIGDKALDDYYLSNVSFKSSWDKAKDFENTLDILYDKIELTNLINHEVIHLVLFSKFMKELNQQSWKEYLLEAFIEFRRNLKNSNKQDDEYWLKYGQYIGVSAGSRNTILKRHEFFVLEMLKMMFKENRLSWKLITIDEDSNNSRYISESMHRKIDAVNSFINANLQEPTKFESVLLRYFRGENKKDETDSNNVQNRETYRISNLVAKLYDDSKLYGDSCNKLVPQLFPHLQGKSNNNAKVVFGEIHKYKNEFIGPDEEFWRLVEYVTFRMNNKNYTIYRDQIEGFCHERFKS